MRFFAPQIVLLIAAATSFALPIINPQQPFSLEKRGGPGDASGSGSGKGKGRDNRPPSPPPPSIHSTPPNSRPSSPRPGDYLRMGVPPANAAGAPPVPRVPANAFTAPRREVKNIPGGRNEALARLEGTRPLRNDPNVRNAFNAAVHNIANRQRQARPQLTLNQVAQRIGRMQQVARPPRAQPASRWSASTSGRSSTGSAQPKSRWSSSSGGRSSGSGRRCSSS
ncbi:hypothetical protein M408DRAFT_263409 [Serendipita vermifera MAFF 305830]|uniref:Uncharacterized protein n=1 Tax=Serendipita vermifera MAFF 305830 TaxID=933852 RepID=A0A0C3AVX3_SERVB|nr:hypothetical protein M408DRAFT_263409 [Serendipita vermifera MAFF 305830]